MDLIGYQRSWTALWAALGLTVPPGVWSALVEAYRSPERHYHGLGHIGDSLRRFDAVAHLAREPALVRLALWFHDAVYDTRRSDNEARSAAWADTVLGEAGASAHARSVVGGLIRATDHAAPAPTSDAALLCDVDLAVLGGSARRFEVYQQAVRAEYAWVPEARFVEGRAALLRRFLDRDRIYQTPPFQRRYEARARRNLTTALDRLAGTP